MDELIQLLKNSTVKLRGIDPNIIDKLELHAGGRFPSEYRKFLVAMGNEAGKFMLGSTAFGKDLLHLNESASELLEENNFTPLPDDAFVFWMHQGYQMAFFRFSEGDNPKVYTFSEGANQSEFRVVDSIVDFFKIQLQFSEL